MNWDRKTQLTILMQEFEFLMIDGEFRRAVSRWRDGRDLWYQWVGERCVSAVWEFADEDSSRYAREVCVLTRMLEELGRRDVEIAKQWSEMEEMYADLTRPIRQSAEEAHDNGPWFDGSPM